MYFYQSACTLGLVFIIFIAVEMLLTVFVFTRYWPEPLKPLQANKCSCFLPFLYTHLQMHTEVREKISHSIAQLICNTHVLTHHLHLDSTSENLQYLVSYFHTKSLFKCTLYTLIFTLLFVFLLQIYGNSYFFLSLGHFSSFSEQKY